MTCGRGGRKFDIYQGKCPLYLPLANIYSFVQMELPFTAMTAMHAAMPMPQKNRYKVINCYIKEHTAMSSSLVITDVSCNAVQSVY